jgi:hypothetical protein
VGGEDKEAFGISIGLAGDFNGDKQLDLLIGSPFNDNNTLSDNGLAVLHLF